jgi:hypothetical protein
VAAVTRLTAAMLAAGVIAMSAGCSVAGQTPEPAAARHATTAPAVDATPAPVLARRMTRAQARAAYVRITRPFNAAVAAVNRDVADAAPWSQFRADTLAVIRADRAWARHVLGERIQHPAGLQGQHRQRGQDQGPAEPGCCALGRCAEKMPARRMGCQRCRVPSSAVIID